MGRPKRGIAVEALDAPVSELAIAKAAIEADIVAERAVAVANEVGYDGPINVVSLIAGARHHYEAGGYHYAETAKRLCVLREMVPDGEWIHALNEVGLHPRTAQRFLEIGRRVNDPIWKRNHQLLGGLPKNRVLALFHYLDTQARVEDEELASLATMTVKELESMAAKARIEKQTLAAKLNHAKEEIASLKAETARPGADEEDEAELHRKLIEATQAVVLAATEHLRIVEDAMSSLRTDSLSEAAHYSAGHVISFLAKSYERLGLESSFVARCTAEGWFQHVRKVGAVSAGDQAGEAGHSQA